MLQSELKEIEMQVHAELSKELHENAQREMQAYKDNLQMLPQWQIIEMAPEITAKLTIMEVMMNTSPFRTYQLRTLCDLEKPIEQIYKLLSAQEHMTWRGQFKEEIYDTMKAVITLQNEEPEID